MNNHELLEKCKLRKIYPTCLNSQIKECDSVSRFVFHNMFPLLKNTWPCVIFFSKLAYKKSNEYLV